MKPDILWQCECGVEGTADEIGGRADMRWNGQAWEHHHRYPIGHVRMTPVAPGKTCLWTEDLDYCSWDAACGGAYQFDYDFRNERRGYKFCPNCGREIEIASVKEYKEDA